MPSVTDNRKQVFRYPVSAAVSLIVNTFLHSQSSLLVRFHKALSECKSIHTQK